MFFSWRAKAKLVLAHLAAIGEVHFLEAIEQLDNLLVGLPESLVVSDDGRVLGCGLPKFAPQLEWILGAFVVEQLLIDLGLTRQLCRVAAVAIGGRDILRVAQRDGPAANPPKMQLTSEFAPRRLAPWY